MTINRITPISRSGTITTGGVAQVLMPANTSRHGFSVRNVSAGSLWINESGTATADQNSLEIKTTEFYESVDNCVPISAISIIGATTSQAFYAREW